MMRDFRTLSRTFFPLLLMIGLQQLLALSVNLADNFMLGAYSEWAMSGASLVNQIQFILQQLVAGIGAGVAVLGAQYWGRGEVDPIRRIISLGLKLSLAAGIAFTLVTALFPRQIMEIFTGEGSELVLEQAAAYLSIICWTYVIYAISATLMYSLQSVQIAFIGSIMSACTLVINMVLNYCLIFGNFGAPELGVRGAAVATLCSRLTELVIILVYVLKVDRRLQLKLRHMVIPDTSYLPDYIKTALPMIISGALWGVAQAAQTAILGHISTSAIAANSIASIVFQLFAVFGIACANASSVTIGKTVGEGNLVQVKRYTFMLQIIFLILGAASSLLLFLCKDAVISLYTVTEETRTLTRTFLTILSITTIGTCYEYPVGSGVIAGGGNTRYAFVVDNCFMWIYTIPISALSAFVFQAPPVVTFLILKSDQLLKCIPNIIACNRYRWVRNLTRRA